MRVDKLTIAILVIAFIDIMLASYLIQSKMPPGPDGWPPSIYSNALGCPI